MKNLVITAIIAIVVIVGFVAIYGAFARTTIITGGGSTTQTHGSLVNALLAAIGL